MNKFVDRDTELKMLEEFSPCRIRGNLLSYTGDGKLALAGECKWSRQKVGLRLLKDLKNKIISHSLPVSKKCRFVLFSKSGFSEELIDLSKYDKTIVLGKFA